MNGEHIMSGKLYVVFNETIRNPVTNERLYKIGITRNTVAERYYGLGLKMPGKFETLFVYRFADYAKAEQLIHGIFSKYRENGEWFNLNQKQLDLIKANCEEMGGILVTDEIEEAIETENGDEGCKENVKESSAVAPDFTNISDVVDKNILTSILERGTLHVNDNICFHTTVDVLDAFFGKKYKQGFASYGKCAFDTKQKDKSIWFAPLDQLKRNWTNTMPDENHVLQIYKGDPSELPENFYSKPRKDRAIFVKKPGDEYRFVGMFYVEKVENNTIYIKRRSLELHFREWDIK